MRSRIVIILILLTAAWGLMIARAAFLQVLPNDRLKTLQKKQFQTVVTLNPRRGDVLDRNGNELAVSMMTYSLFADPKIIEEPKKVARQLASELNVPVRSIEEKLQSRRKRFVWIERQLPKSKRDAIDEWKIRGLGFIEESSRVYPNDRLLANVLGNVGGDGQGLEGLELKFNDQLQAVRKSVSLSKDARGRPLIVNGQMFHQVPDGSDVQLTIDREIQFTLEQELHQAVRAQNAEAAIGIVLDAQTSEVLAMASSPSFDPNRARDFSADRKRNRTVTDVFEPGSTMKTFVIAGALTKGILEPNTKFDCENGHFKIGKRVIREADSRHRFGILTVSEILAQSSNIGTTKIAFQLGEDRVRETFKQFGFGEKTGIDFPGEARGILHATPWHDHLLANISFGHGIAATPIQIANAYAAIANGGYLRRPFIVKAIRDHETNDVTETKPKVVRRVLNEDQVAKMRIMLANATSENGTGMNARVPGFPVAGKTGTAQRVNENGRGYLRGGYISSFAGFLPANDPKFVIYIAVDRPKKEYYGASVAAPVFSRVAKFAVRRAGLAPVLITESNVVPSARRQVSVVPRVHRPIEDFATVQQAVARNGAATAAPARHPEAANAVVPDLTGLTLREVLSRISGSDISVQVRGHGFVTRTVPGAGARFPENKDLTVILE